MYLAAEPDHRRNLEAGDRDHADVNRGGDQRGRRERQRNQHKAAHPADAVHGRGLVESRAQGAENRSRHHEGERGEAETFDPSHADDIGDAERRRMKTERPDQPGVQHADPRMQEEHPAHRHEDRRQQKDRRHQRIDHPSGGKVRALDQPGRGDPNAHGHDRADDDEIGRVLERVVDHRVFKQRSVVAQRHRCCKA